MAFSLIKKYLGGEAPRRSIMSYSPLAQIAGQISTARYTGFTTDSYPSLSHYRPTFRMPVNSLFRYSSGRLRNYFNGSSKPGGGFYDNGIGLGGKDSSWRSIFGLDHFFNFGRNRGSGEGDSGGGQDYGGSPGSGSESPQGMASRSPAGIAPQVPGGGGDAQSEAYLKALGEAAKKAEAAKKTRTPTSTSPATARRPAPATPAASNPPEAEDPPAPEPDPEPVAWSDGPKIKPLKEFIQTEASGVLEIEADETAKSITIKPHSSLGDVGGGFEGRVEYAGRLIASMGSEDNAVRFYKLVKELPGEATLKLGPAGTVIEDKAEAEGIAILAALEGWNPQKRDSQDLLKAGYPPAVRYFIERYSGSGNSIDKPQIKVGGAGSPQITIDLGYDKDGIGTALSGMYDEEKNGVAQDILSAARVVSGDERVSFTLFGKEFDVGGRIDKASAAYLEALQEYTKPKPRAEIQPESEPEPEPQPEPAPAPEPAPTPAPASEPVPEAPPVPTETTQPQPQTTPTPAAASESAPAPSRAEIARYVDTMKKNRSYMLDDKAIQELDAIKSGEETGGYEERVQTALEAAKERYKTVVREYWAQLGFEKDQLTDEGDFQWLLYQRHSTPEKAKKILDDSSLEWREFQQVERRFRDEVVGYLVAAGADIGKSDDFGLSGKIQTLDLDRLRKIVAAFGELKRTHVPDLNAALFSPERIERTRRLQQMMDSLESTLAGQMGAVAGRIDAIMNTGRGVPKFVEPLEPGQTDIVELGGKTFRRVDTIGQHYNGDDDEHVYVVLKPDATQEQVEGELARYARYGFMEEGWIYLEYKEDGKTKKILFEIGKKENPHSLISIGYVLQDMWNGNGSKKKRKIVAMTDYHNHPSYRPDSGLIKIHAPSGVDIAGSLADSRKWYGERGFSGRMDCRVVTELGVFTFSTAEKYRKNGKITIESIESAKDGLARYSEGGSTYRSPKEYAGAIRVDGRVDSDFRYFNPGMEVLIDRYTEVQALRSRIDLLNSNARRGISVSGTELERLADEFDTKAGELNDAYSVAVEAGVSSEVLGDLAKYVAVQKQFAELNWKRTQELLASLGTSNPT